MTDAPPPIGPGRVVKALGYSIDGLTGAWRTEGAFRQEVPVACEIVAIPKVQRQPYAAHGPDAVGHALDGHGVAP